MGVTLIDGIKMSLERETKGTFVYAEDGKIKKEYKIGKLYIMKCAVEGEAPKNIEVSVSATSPFKVV